MRAPADPTNANYAKIITTQQAIISSVFTTTARVEQTRLRQQEADKMEELLATLERERSR